MGGMVELDIELKIFYFNTIIKVLGNYEFNHLTISYLWVSLGFNLIITFSLLIGHFNNCEIFCEKVVRSIIIDIYTRNWLVFENWDVLTVLSFVIPSGVGFWWPNKLSTSCLAFSCQSVWIDSRNTLQVSKLLVVSCPAK